MFIEPEPHKLDFRSYRSEMCCRSFAPKGAKRIQENHSAINISPRWGEGKSLWMWCNFNCKATPAGCPPGWPYSLRYMFCAQCTSLVLLPPAPAACLLIHQGWPNRARYSGDEMKAKTICASCQLP